jgi:hypothetical protein
MYAGVDVNGQLKFSGQLNGPLDDQFKGPITELLATTTQAVSDQSWIFPITKAQILDHISNYNSPGYVVPSSIGNWPAHGDVSLGYDFYLAPFVDSNNDGAYIPADGDYPCIRGDEATYVIMNDKYDIHQSGGQPLGIEMHYMFYQYTTNDALNDVTFVHGKVINRGTQLIHDMKVSIFLDGDLGYSQDDYYGSDSTRSLMYFYNGDDLDETDGNELGYGTNPPAVGVVSLKNDFSYIGNLTGLGFTPAILWNFMNGTSFNGIPWSNSATGVPTNYLYSENPVDLIGYDTEVGQGNGPGDRKGLATINMGTFTSGSELEFDMAFVYSRDQTTAIDNVTALKLTSDFVQNFYDNEIPFNCFESSVGMNELPGVNFSIHPNPSSGQFTVSLGTDFSNAEIKVYDISGRSVIKHMELKSKESNIEVNQPAGVYLLHLTVDGRESVKRIILE